jgi:hypothetical protein
MKRKISTTAFIDSYGRSTHRFSLMFIISAVEMLSLNKKGMDLKRRPVRYDAALLGPRSN